MADREVPAVIAERPFESAIFGGPVWQLRPEHAPDSAVLRDVVRSAAAMGVRLIACRVPSALQSAALRAAGFLEIEELVTFRRPIGPAAPPPGTVGRAAPGDVAACTALAATAFRCNRFNADPRVPRHIAGEIKARWARNDLEGRADAAFVAREEGGVAGFNLCLLSGREAIIDLIAVSPERRGRGLGADLIMAALAHYSGRADVLSAGTQAANAPSTALYRKLGFVPVRRETTFHWMP